MPSALAVFRLITSSNLVARSIGWRFTGFRALEDLVHVCGRAPVHVGTVCPIAHETASVRVLLRIYEDRGQSAFCRKVRDSFEIRIDHWTWPDEESLRVGPDCPFECFVDIVEAPYLHRVKLDSQLSCRALDFLPIACPHCGVRIPEHRHSREFGNHFLEQFQPFSRPSSTLIWDNPVTLPPGRADSSTSPNITGSVAAATTMGIALVAFLAATASTVTEATMTATLSRTRSVASSGSRSSFPLHSGTRC